MIKSESGQTLIIVVLVMVLSLATGLAVSTRSTSTVHQTTNLAVSEQSLAAAESAAEIMLKQTLGSTGLLATTKAAGFDKGADLVTDCSALPCYKYMDAANTVKASVNVVTTPDVAASSPFDFYLEVGDVQQVWLNGFNGQVNICWQKSGEVGTDGLPAALEIKVITGSGHNYSMSTYAYDASPARQTANHFASPMGTPSSPYNICNNSFALANAQALRIKALYAGASVRVSPVSPAIIPYQGNIITTTGYVGETKRTVQVTKTLPQLPALFDYGIYSGGIFSK